MCSLDRLNLLSTQTSSSSEKQLLKKNLITYCHPNANPGQKEKYTVKKNPKTLTKTINSLPVYCQNINTSFSKNNLFYSHSTFLGICGQVVLLRSFVDHLWNYSEHLFFRWIRHSMHVNQMHCRNNTENMNNPQTKKYYNIKLLR